MELRKPRFWSLFAAFLLSAGAFVTIQRFGWGLGTATNLSDTAPWGLWIGFDVVTGVGLAAGGFTIAGIVYIFNLKRFKPIARPAILTAFLGYLLVIVGLLFDLGRPWAIWHALIYQNPHSVLFEVAMCVMTYTTVLALEFSPAVLERFRLKRALRVIKALTIPLIIAGILLSMLHQSSLGSLYLIVPQKMHGLWYSSMLPVLFFTSAVTVGLAMTIVEAYLSARAFGKTLETPLLRDLARAMIGILFVFFTMRFIDMAHSGAIGLIAEGSFESTMFLIELFFLLVLPVVLFNIRGFGRTRRGLFFTAFSVVLGFVTNRLNVTTTSLERYYMDTFGSSYFPAVGEIVITASIVTMGFVLFSLAVKYLDIFPEVHPSEGLERVLFRAPATKPESSVAAAETATTH